MQTVKPKKGLGQHFLRDLKIAQAIADTVDARAGIPVLEIGPGMGVLTQYLIPKDRILKVVELDSESVVYLKDHYPTLDIIEGDFLKLDLRNLFEGKEFVLTGNYPYNISSQIFFKMLDNMDIIPCCTGMVQREVAQRICSGPGNKSYGILSVLIQAWYDTEYLFTVNENVFDPPPKVKSAVIRLTKNSREDFKGRNAEQNLAKDTILVHKSDLAVAAVLGIVSIVSHHKNLSLGDRCGKGLGLGIVIGGIVGVKGVGVNDQITAVF
jgi:16S rRNA (adenine1518-N6/adenine1519-N6)-dimethyltransferase